MKELTNSTKAKEEIIIGNLKDLKEILDKYNVEFWLETGTLLGAVRDKKLIPWDWDIDLSFKEEDFKKILSAAPEFKKKGFIMREVLQPLPDEEFLNRKYAFYRYGFPTELDMYYKKGENFMLLAGSFDQKDPGKGMTRIFNYGSWLLWNTLTSGQLDSDSRGRRTIERLVRYCLFLFPPKLKNHLIKSMKPVLIKRNYADFSGMRVIPEHYFEKLDRIQFYGMTFNIPSDVENYLSCLYGDNWRIPDRKWDGRNTGVKILSKIKTT